MGLCTSASNIQKPVTTIGNEILSPNCQGNAAYDCKDYISAVKFYSEALLRCPDGPKAHIYLANRATSYQKLARYDESIADLLQSINKDSNYLRSWKQLAQTYSYVHNLPGAMEAWQRCIDLDPDEEKYKNSLLNLQIYLEKEGSLCWTCCGSAVPRSKDN